MSLDVKFREMRNTDTNHVIRIIGQAMNIKEARRAAKTIYFHYFCRENKKDDGREYYIAENKAQIIGVCGLHNYIWGPEDTAWLGWFAVDPEFQRQGIGRKMLKKVCSIGAEKGYKKLLVETYSDCDFKKARNFYEKSGCKEVGRIKDYIKKGIDMVVYKKDL